MFAHRKAPCRDVAAAIALLGLAAAFPRPARAELKFDTLFVSVMHTADNFTDLSIAVRGDFVAVMNTAAWNGPWQQTRYHHSTNDCATWESDVVVSSSTYYAPKWRSLFLEENANPVFAGEIGGTNLARLWWSTNNGVAGTWANAAFTHTATPTNVAGRTQASVRYSNGNIGFSYMDTMPTPQIHYAEFTGSPSTGYTPVGPGVSLGNRGDWAWLGMASAIGHEGRFRTFWGNGNDVRMAAIMEGGGTEQRVVFNSGSNEGMPDAAVDPATGKYFVTHISPDLRLSEFAYNETGGLISNTTIMIAEAFGWTNRATHARLGFGANNELLIAYLYSTGAVASAPDVFLQVRDIDGSWHTNRLTGAGTGYSPAGRGSTDYGGCQFVNLDMATAYSGVKTYIYLVYGEYKVGGSGINTDNTVVMKLEMRQSSGTFVKFW